MELHHIAIAFGGSVAGALVILFLMGLRSAYRHSKDEHEALLRDIERRILFPY